MPKKGGKKPKVIETPEEKALREETERLKDVEDRKKKDETMRTLLTENMAQEAQFAKLNIAKIQNRGTSSCGWQRSSRCTKTSRLCRRTTSARWT